MFVTMVCLQKETATALETTVYESLLHGSLSSTYDGMLTAAQKAKKKSLSAWSLATKLTSSHISNKQKKPPTEETSGEITCLVSAACLLLVLNSCKYFVYNYLAFSNLAAYSATLKVSIYPVISSPYVTVAKTLLA